MISSIFGSSTSEENVGSFRSSNYTVTGCGNSNYDRYVHGDREIWKLLRQAYNRAIQNDEEEEGEGEEPSTSYEGMQVQFEVRKDNLGLKRSLHLTESVKKGTQIWEAYNYHAFRRERDYISFLKELEPYGHSIQCDVLTMTHVDESSSYVEITLDEGTFIQHANSAEDINLDMYCIATRDIAAGEKLMMNTTEFLGTESVEWFEELKTAAFKRTGLGGPRSTIPPVVMNNNNGRTDSISNSSVGKQIVLAPAILFCLFFISKQFRGHSSKHSSEFSKKAD